MSGSGAPQELRISGYTSLKIQESLKNRESGDLLYFFSLPEQILVPGILLSSLKGTSTSCYLCTKVQASSLSSGRCWRGARLWIPDVRLGAVSSLAEIRDPPFLPRQITRPDREWK